MADVSYNGISDYHELQEECKARDLSAQGTKEELVARLEADDAVDEDASDGDMDNPFYADRRKYLRAVNEVGEDASPEQLVAAYEELEGAFTDGYGYTPVYPQDEEE